MVVIEALFVWTFCGLALSTNSLKTNKVFWLSKVVGLHFSARVFGGTLYC